MSFERMGIAPRNEGHVDFEAPGKLLLLRFVESPEQPPAAIGTINADGT
jgi:hypothetical protein